MPFFQADVTFRFSGATARQPWKDDVVLGPAVAGAHVGKRTCLVWAETEADMITQVGRTGFVFDGQAAGDMSYSVEDRALTVIDPVETGYFDRDPSADEDGDPDLDDRAEGWYYRYATDGEDGWSGAHESQEDALREAKDQNLDIMENSLAGRDRAHEAALFAASGIVSLLEDGPDDATDRDTYVKLRSFHVALDQALHNRRTSALRHEVSSRLAAEIDTLDEPARAPRP